MDTCITTTSVGFSCMHVCKLCAHRHGLCPALSLASARSSWSWSSSVLVEVDRVHVVITVAVVVSVVVVVVVAVVDAAVLKTTELVWSQCRTTD